MGSPPAPALDPDILLARARSENYPVASRLLPRPVRAHLLAVYGFARLADDIGDEADGDRPAQLDWLAEELRAAVVGEARHPLLRRVGDSIRALGLPLEPFDDLIEANRHDQVVDHYERFDDLKASCMLSAAPIGRLVLAVWGCATPERIALSDNVCIGLQLTEHIQDVGEDARRGRTYLPMAQLRAAGCEQADLLAAKAGGPLRRVLADEVGRARRFLSCGPALAATLPWRERLAFAGFVGGGMAALDAVVRADFDVLGRSCRPSPSGVVRRAVGVLSAARSGGRPTPMAGVASR